MKTLGCKLTNASKRVMQLLPPRLDAQVAEDGERRGQLRHGLPLANRRAGLVEDVLEGALAHQVGLPVLRHAQEVGHPVEQLAWNSKVLFTSIDNTASGNPWNSKVLLLLITQLVATPGTQQVPTPARLRGQASCSCQC
eukprot:10758120-Lingulodinium_polyedra.AAC.1